MQEGTGVASDPVAESAPTALAASARASHAQRLPDGLTWHGYLIQLLHIASEIEHALMVQYLYAAYSLDDEHPRERKKVAQWRSLLLSVAKEEMGHLLTVQNVLCLLGGRRPNEARRWD
jgi:rubrerythrin